MTGTFEQIAAALAHALRPLTFALNSDDDIKNFVELLGWTLPSVPPSLVSIRDSLVQLHMSLADLGVAQGDADRGDGDASNVDDAAETLLADLALAIANLYQLPEHLRTELSAPFVAATHIDEELADRALDWLLSNDMARSAAVFYRVLRLVGIVEVTDEPEDPVHFQPAFERHRIHWNRFLQITDPASLARDVYGWGTPTFDTARLFRELIPLSFALGMPGEVRYASPEFMKHVAATVDPNAEPIPQLWMPLIQTEAFTLFLVAVGTPSAAATDPQGLALALVPSAGGEFTVPLGDGLELDVKTMAQIGTGAALIVRPDGPPSAVLDMDAPTGSALTSGSLRVALTWRVEEEDSPAGLANSGTTGISARAMSMALGAEATASDTDVFAELAITDATVVVAAPNDDGLLASVLPDDGLKATFSLTVHWSRDGIRFQGSGGLAIALPLLILIGPLKLQSLELAVENKDSSMSASAALTASIELGPMTLTIQGVGLACDVRASHGNLGPFDLDVHFKPPSGVGFAIDSAGVSGGGFLGHDDAKHEYSGMLQLQFTDLALQAFGLITTQVAGGNGYSLLVMIDADFQPIQLGWGFTLNGVGGLLAMHRTASVDALRAALKADKLGTILFPKNAITNAPQILAELDTLFPTAPGRFLFGPMALIGWGTPSLLTVALAIIIELPEPIRIVLLARLAVRLPSESDSLVRINMDALGVLDLGQDSLSLDATLFDSRLLKFTLSGDMALRANWAGEPREFLLSVGGFHPRFTPPAGFPTLKRMSIDMSSGSIATLHLESYLAITSNTLEIGANLHVVVKVSAFSVDGHLGFDALFQRDPFHFDGDISGAVAVSIDGYDLLSVSLDATLTGPAPWNIAGNFKVHIVFVDVHKSFSHTWGDDAPAEQIAAVDVGALLAGEFADPRSWGAQLADGTPALVSARDVQNAAVVVAHPLALLEVHERTVPLGMDITRVGGAPLSGANHFAITGFRIGGSGVPSENVQDDFAAAEFLDMSDDEKLAQPSFERHDAGVRLKRGLITSGSPINKNITYETFFVDEVGGEPRTDPGTPVQPWLLADLQAVLSTGSAARATMMRAGNRRYTAPGNPIRVAEPAFVLVDADTLAPVGIGPASGVVYGDVRALLNQELNRVPALQGHLQIVATHEMVAPNA